MSAVLADVRVELEQAQAQSQGEYRAVVEALAEEDEGCKPADAMRVLEATGRTLDQLNADVARLIRRRQLAADLEQREAAEARAQLAEADVQQLHRRREEMLAESDRLISGARDRLAEATSVIRRAKAAHTELLADADPALVARRNELYAELKAASAALKALREQLARLEAAAAVDIPEFIGEPGRDPFVGQRHERDCARRLRDRTAPQVQTEADRVAQIQAQIADVGRLILAAA